MKKVVFVVALTTLASMLLSCGAAVTETGGELQEPLLSETDSTETAEIPEEPDVYSRLVGASATDDENVYAINFAHGKSVTFNAAEVKKAYEEAQGRGFEGNFDRFLNLSLLDAKTKFYSDESVGAMAFGRILAHMFENYAEYFVLFEGQKEYEVKVEATEGFVNTVGLSYANSSTQTYRYTQKIKVAAGQTLELVCNGKKVAMRYAVAYKNGAPSDEDSLNDAGCNKTTYPIPDGVNEVVATFKATDGDVFALVIGDAEAKPVLQDKVDDEFFRAMLGESLPEADIVKSLAILKDDAISLGANHVMNNKRLVLTFDIDALGEGEMISLGHGASAAGGSALEITKTHLRSYYYMSKQEEYLNTAHGLDISGRVTVIVRVGFGEANIRLETESGVFVTGDFKWGGRNGEIFAKSVGAELNNVTLSWGCSDFDQKIWMLGDSYFNMTDASRWPTYMLAEGYTDYLLTGYPGRKSEAALADFKNLLAYGKPKYAVWCMGMNDGDKANGVNASWEAATEEFIAICDDNGIIPVLATIPNTPTVINTFKNEIVRASGCRYIDFAAAVDGTETGSPWTSGMLSSDNVHPAKSGARALWEQVEKDLGDILR